MAAKKSEVDKALWQALREGEAQRVLEAIDAGASLDSAFPDSGARGVASQAWEFIAEHYGSPPKLADARWEALLAGARRQGWAPSAGIQRNIWRPLIGAGFGEREKQARRCVDAIGIGLSPAHANEWRPAEGTLWEFDDVEAARLMLDGGWVEAGLDAQGRSPALAAALGSGFPRCAELLISKGFKPGLAFFRADGGLIQQGLWAALGTLFRHGGWRVSSREAQRANAFFESASERFERCADLIESFGADPNEPDSQGNMPLALATRLHQGVGEAFFEPMARRLIKAGGDIGRPSKTLSVLGGAAHARGEDSRSRKSMEKASIELMEALAGLGADPRRDPMALGWAASADCWGKTDIRVRWLLGRGAAFASEGGERFGEELRVAVHGTGERLFKALIEAKAPQGVALEKGGTLLHECVEAGRNGRPKMPTLLLGELAGAIERKDDAGRTPLWAAASKLEEATLRALLAAGADHSARDAKGDAPIHAAARKWGVRSGPKVEGVLRALVEAGADIKAVDKKGLSVGALLAERGDERALAFALELDPSQAQSGAKGGAKAADLMEARGGQAQSIAQKAQLRLAFGEGGAPEPEAEPREAPRRRSRL